ncbi:MAG TPA: hypothetical protein VF350_06550 [Candidatus Bathyarchaeia archaeon]
MENIRSESGNPSFVQFPHTHLISDTVALRVHSDTEPKNMKTAQLQKGLILLYKGTEVIGEGIGFGVPIVKYSDETVFSGSSSLRVRTLENFVEIRKEFIMDLVTRNTLRNFKLENPKIRTLLDGIAALYKKQYQSHVNFARYILLMRSLLFKFGVKSTFLRSTSKGVVVVTYIIDRNRILVKLDLSSLDRNNLGKIFVLNEQGAHFFRTYSDSESLKLDDEAIGAWNEVTSQSAKITNAQDKIGFSLKNVEGTKLRRGRELIKGSLDWIGLDYELGAEYSQFEYEIEVFG